MSSDRIPGVGPRYALANRLLAASGARWRAPAEPCRDAGAVYWSDPPLIVCDPPDDDYRLATLLHELGHVDQGRTTGAPAVALMAELQSWQWARERVIEAGMEFSPDMVQNVHDSMGEHLETHRVYTVTRVEGDTGGLYDFPCSETYRRYEAWLLGEPLPELPPAEGECPHNGGWTNIESGAHLIGGPRAIMEPTTAKAKPPERRARRLSKGFDV